MATCKGFKNDGLPCSSTIVFDNGYCRWHQDQDVVTQDVLDEDVQIQSVPVDNVDVQYVRGQERRDQILPVRVVTVQDEQDQELHDQYMPDRVVSVQDEQDQELRDQYVPDRVVTVKDEQDQDVGVEVKKTARSNTIPWNDSRINLGITVTIAISTCIFLTGIIVGVFGLSDDGGFTQDLSNVCMELLPIFSALFLLVILYDGAVILFLAIKGKLSKDHDDRGNPNQRSSLSLE